MAEAEKKDGSEPVVIRMPVDVRSAALTVIATVAGIFVLQQAQSVLIPTVLGVLISYALSPMVTSLAHHHVPRVAGAALAVIVLVGGIGAGVYTLSDEAMAVVADVPEAARRLRERVVANSRRGSALQQMQEAAKALEKTADIATKPEDAPPPAREGVQRVQIEQPSFKASDYLWIGGVGLVGFIGQFAMIPFSSISSW
jgi:predicted PurR-regulated permease PerM